MTDFGDIEDVAKRRLEKLETGVISGGRVFAMISWAIIAAPVWLIMILVALLFLLFLTVVRALTAINFSVDRQLLRMVARSYPNGFRYLQTEFNKLEREMEEEEDDAKAEWSYLFRMMHLFLLLVIAVTLYCIYAKINILSLPEYAYAGAGVVVVAAFLLAWLADRRSEHDLIEESGGQKGSTVSPNHET